VVIRPPFHLLRFTCSPYDIRPLTPAPPLLSVTMADTPLLVQYRDIKAQHPDAILFFRMGDFYEMFYDDATTAARVLNITLTARGDGVPLAGVPVKAAAGYLRTFIAAGHRVAICEQIEDPKFAKGIVKRAVVETITPGAFLDEEYTPGSRNNWLVAVHRHAQGVGVAALDLSTGELLLETVPVDGLAEAIGRLAPAELVVARDAEPLPAHDEILRTTREPWEFDAELATEELARRLSLASLDGLGLGPADTAAIGAAGALLRYVTDLQPAGLPHLRRPTVRRADDLCWIDEMTRRNLELVEPLRAGAKGVTLFEVLDRTMTPMGARMLRQWVVSPLQGCGAHPRTPRRRRHACDAGSPARASARRPRWRARRRATRRARRCGPRRAARTGRAARLVPSAPRARGRAARGCRR
jgi:DNA mismatch repair protein MutS